MLKISREDLERANSDAEELAKIHKNYWKEARYQILKEFCKGSRSTLSVGCGVREPIIIGATTATDITPLVEKHLRSAGWKGQFKVAEPWDLPFRTKDFDVVVCSEVIEHIKDPEQIRKTFQEVDRVGIKWIITCPNSEVIKPSSQNPRHLHFFDLRTIKYILPLKCEIFTNDHHIYMKKV